MRVISDGAWAAFERKSAGCLASLKELISGGTSAEDILIELHHLAMLTNAVYLGRTTRLINTLHQTILDNLSIDSDELATIAVDVIKSIEERLDEEIGRRGELSGDHKIMFTIREKLTPSRRGRYIIIRSSRVCPVWRQDHRLV